MSQTESQRERDEAAFVDWRSRNRHYPAESHAWHAALQYLRSLPEYLALVEAGRAVWDSRGCSNPQCESCERKRKVAVAKLREVGFNG